MERNSRQNPYLCLLPDGLVNHVVIWDDLLLGGEGQILHSSVLLLEVDVAQTTVEEDLARVQLELQAQLLIVDVVVATEIKKRVVEVGKGLFEIAHEEVGHALLEVGDSEILVQPHSALVAVDLENGGGSA